MSTPPRVQAPNSSGPQGGESQVPLPLLSPDTCRDALPGTFDKHLSIVKQGGVAPHQCSLPFRDEHLASSSVAKGSILYFSQSKEAACPERGL